MLAVLAVIVITVQIKIVSGIGNKTIKMSVQKGDSVVLKCSNYEGVMSWLGPDVNNVGQRGKLFFSNNHKNPKLNLTEYSLQENEGSYDLIIANFLEKNAGSYICSFTKDGSFRETKYHVSLLDKEKGNETTTISYTDQTDWNISSITMPLQTTNCQFPKSKQGNRAQNSVMLLVLIPLVLIAGSFTIIGILAKVKRITIGEMLSFFLLSCRRDTERNTATDDITEQDNTVENQLYQNSNVSPNENLSEPDADLGVSEDTGAASNYINTCESTAVRLHQCTAGLHYAEVLIKPVTSQQIIIHGIENRTIYTGIDHSLNRGVVHSDHSDNDSADDFIYIQNLDVNSRNYENTCL
ncbi:uncharacterized protein [Mytilus edulis]|uniref:uncharacterized protein n=1 Tax=Mytilus edulis TaxID=6550 RepID=UPI0039EDEC2F